MDITTKVARRDNEDGEDMVSVGFSRSVDDFFLTKKEARRLASSLHDVLSDINEGSHD